MAYRTPGVGHAQGVFGVFSNYRLVMLFLNMVCLVVAFALRRQQERIALLRTLVVDAPKHLQKALPSVYKGLVFKYFDNYVALVEGELALFNIPLRVEVGYFPGKVKVG
jgi:hypothetical protein